MGKKRGKIGQHMSTDNTTSYHIPGFFIPHIAQYVSAGGADADLLYAAADIDRASFSPREHTVTEDQLYAFVKLAEKLSNEPAFGLEIGHRFNLGSFGLLSSALMSCATLRDVVQMLERYSVLVLPLLRFTSYETETELVLEITALASYPDLNQTIIEALLSCSTKMFPLLVGRHIPANRICCQFEAPPYANRFPAAMAREFSFGAEKNLICLKREYADLKLVTANSTDASSMMAECEKALIRSLQTKSLTDQVVDLVRYYLDTNPASHQIAQRLNMTERTLRRKLSEEGTNYRKLLAGIREDVAKYYLSQTKLQIGQIALKLGYGETSNFRSAFKIWTGMPPRDWRQNQRDDSR